MEAEKELRKIWTAQGVSIEQQDALIRDITAKAQVGAKVGPFTIGQPRAAVQKANDAMTQRDLEDGELGRARVRSLRKIEEQENERRMQLELLRGHQSKLRATKPQQSPGGLFEPRQLSLLG